MGPLPGPGGQVWPSSELGATGPQAGGWRGPPSPPSSAGNFPTMHWPGALSAECSLALGPSVTAAVLSSRALLLAWGRPQVLLFRISSLRCFHCGHSGWPALASREPDSGPQWEQDAPGCKALSTPPPPPPDLCTGRTAVLFEELELRANPRPGSPGPGEDLASPQLL